MDCDKAVAGDDTSKSSPSKQPKAKHGTRVLSSVIVQEPNHEHSQIRIQGTSSSLSTSCINISTVLDGSLLIDCSLMKLPSVLAYMDCNLQYVDIMITLSHIFCS